MRSAVDLAAIIRFALRNLPPGFLQDSPQQELDLRVQAAQVVVGPALERVEDVAIDPQQERLPVGHGPTDRSFPC